jgi:hypothetical protein
MIIRIALLIIITITIACNDTGSKASNDLKAQEDSLWKDVEDGHNVGMGKMSKIARSITQVQQSLDSLNKLPSKKIDTVYRQQLLSLKEELTYADMSMNSWMNEFKYDSAKDNPELRIKYLQSEKDKVTKVRDNILNGLQKADSLLKK